MHLADVHIGMENYGRLDPETGSSTTLRAFLSTLDEAVDRAIAEPVDLVVIAGDIYKSRDPSPTHQREFARRVLRLARAGVQVLIVAGNHDIPMATGRATSIDIFRVLELPGVTVTRNIEMKRIETRSGPVQVLTLPWLVKHALISQDEHKNKSLEEVLTFIVERAESLLEAEAGELDPAIPALLVGHAHVFGARVGAERLLTLGTDPMFNISVLDLPNLDYIALGHIHKHQTVSTGRTPTVYAGSINRVDFGEEAEDKGFILAEVQRGKTEWEFVPVKARPFLTIRSEPITEDPTDEVVKSILRAGPRVRGAVVRLQLVGTRARLQQIDEREVRLQLREAEYLAPIQREITDQVRVRLAGQDIAGRTPLDLLDLYFQQKQVADARRDELLAVARGLLAE